MIGAMNRDLADFAPLANQAALDERRAELSDSGLVSTTDVLDELLDTGLTYRILDYWIRCGVITPTVEAAGSGSWRGFSGQDRWLIRILARVHAGLAVAPVGFMRNLADRLLHLASQGSVPDQLELTLAPGVVLSVALDDIDTAVAA